MPDNLTTLALAITPPFAYITLDRPHAANTMNDAMVADLSAALETVNERGETVRAIIIAGAGGQFSAGSTDERIDDIAAYDALLTALRRAPQVIIARVEGIALGGGLGLICAADIAIATAETRFAAPDVRLGLVPGAIMPHLMRRVGPSRARELLLMGRLFDGVSAHEYGLVQYVCPAESLNRVVTALLDELRQCSPAALRASKQLLTDLEEQPTALLTAERSRAEQEARAHPDAAEGIDAYEMGRSARWSQ